MPENKLQPASQQGQGTPEIQLQEVKKDYPPVVLDNVRVFPVFKEGSLKGFASMTVNGQIAMENMRILEGKNGLYVKPDGYMDKRGKWREPAFPVTKEMYRQIQDTVLPAYRQAMVRIQEAASAQMEQQQPEPQGQREQQPPEHSPTLGM